jgi:hypothetical protein
MMEKPAMTAKCRLKLSAAMFAVLWSAGMIWWSGDYSLPRIVIFSIAGAIGGLLWFWLMAKWQRWVLAHTGGGTAS